MRHVVFSVLLSCLWFGPALAGDESGAPGNAPGNTWGVRCDGYEFVAVFDDAQVELILPDRRLTLPQARAASGIRYELGGTVFWGKGREAMLEFDGRRHTGCRLEPAVSIWEAAALRGVDFRAVGNEPGWHLEILDGVRIQLVADYGQKRVSTPAPEPIVDGERTIYRVETEAHRLEIVIDHEACADTMSEETFTARATVILDDQTLEGCGRSL